MRTVNLSVEETISEFERAWGTPGLSRLLSMMEEERPYRVIAREFRITVCEVKILDSQPLRVWAILQESTEHQSAPALQPPTKLTA